MVAATGEPWHCRGRESDMPRTAATLALPCHKGRDQPMCDRPHLTPVVEDTCRGLSITPEQLRRELREGGELADMESGNLSAYALHLTAETLAIMRYPSR
jgi:hypothetical protein